MKKLMILFLFSMFAVASIAQTLKENTVDDFSKNVIKRTSWERLMSNLKGTAYFRISKINDYYFFDLKFMDGSIFSIDKNDKMMFILDNDSVFTLNNLKYVISSKGAGAVGFVGSEGYGIQTSYVNLEGDGLRIMCINRVIKFRFSTNSGYIENEVNPKTAEKIIKAIKLVE